MSDTFSAPVLHTISEGVIVKRPIGHASPPQIGPSGGVSIGTEYLPIAGAVVHVAVHDPDGTTLNLTLGRAALIDFATLMNGAVSRIGNGLVRPETAQ